MKDLDEKTKAWLAVRKEAAKTINPATAEVICKWGQVIDPYGILPEIPDGGDCVGKNYFARAPGSDIWVSIDDLPQSVVDELWKRMDVDRLVTEIMARDDGEPGYAAAVARGIMKAQSV